MRAAERSLDGATCRDTVPLRVLVWHWGRGGAGSKYALELACGLHALQEIHVTVAATRGGELAAGAASAGLPVDAISTFEGRRATLAGRASAAAALAKIPFIGLAFAATLRRHRIDVVICAMQTIWDVAALPVLRATGIPFLMVLHDAEFRDGDRYPLRHRVLASEVAAAHGVVVLTGHVRDRALEVHRLAPDRVWTVPHGAFTFPGAPNRQRHLDTGRLPRLLFLGRILPYKGLGLLLDACRVLCAEGTAVILDILGDGDLGPHRPAISRLEHVNIVNRWLSEAEIATAIAGADILVLPYLDASQSGVAAGALAAGLPIVATPVGGLAEQVRHGVTGVMADAATAPALAEAIRTAISDPVSYAAMSRAALAEASGPLGWPRVAADFARVAADLTDRERKKAVT